MKASTRTLSLTYSRSFSVKLHFKTVASLHAKCPPNVQIQERESKVLQQINKNLFLSQCEVHDSSVGKGVVQYHSNFSKAV